MGFYMCPFEYRVQRLFKSCPEKLMRPRQSISQRARRAYESRLSDPDSVRLDVAGSETFRDSRVLHLVLRHFLPLFEGATVQVWPEAEERDHITVDLTAHSADKILKKNEIKKEITLLDFEFTLYPWKEQMEMTWIRGNPRSPGYAGQALTSLYNVARDLRLPRIYYYVDPKNTNAKRFYYHTDFGRPVQWGSATWEVFPR